MDGVHDLGGMHGFGPVTREANEPPFHAPWEAAVVAMMRATLHGAGLYNIDEFRHGIERMEPAHYLASSYFEHWLDGIARILIEKGVIDLAELDARTAFFLERPGLPASAAARGAPVASVSSTRGPRHHSGPPGCHRASTWVRPCSRATCTRAGTRGCRVTLGASAG